MHSIRFPNETPAYRTARNTLLDAERDLRRQVEAVAAQRRELALGGEIPQDYAFQQRSGGAVTIARMSELFGEGRTRSRSTATCTAPTPRAPCPMCTSILDALDGTTDHATQRIALVAVAKSPIDRVLEIAKGAQLASAAPAVVGEEHLQPRLPRRIRTTAGGSSRRSTSSVRRDGAIRHSWSSELLYEASAIPPRSRGTST